GSASACVYYLICIVSAVKFLRENRNKEISSEYPSISILKPLKGVDPGMYGNLRSHCIQDYPNFEIVFGVSDAADPALEFVRNLQNEFPHVAVRVVVCPEKLGANVKVSNLAQMLREAQNKLIVVNDSDIRVLPDYLRRIASRLGDPKTGLVTCLYRG